MFKAVPCVFVGLGVVQKCMIAFSANDFCFIMKCKTPWCMKGKQILLQCVSDEVGRHQKLLFPSGTLSLFHPRGTSVHNYVLLNYELN